MFGSQVLETAIGLAVLFFIVATAASAILEVVARLYKKRSKDLWNGISYLLVGAEQETAKGQEPREVTAQGSGGNDRDPGPTTALDLFKETSVWRSAQLAAGHTLFKHRPNGPSYLSAKAFAEAVTEYMGRHPKVDSRSEGRNPRVDWGENLERRLAAIALEGQTSILSLKSGLERWFDEAMARAEGSYKRWATMILFLIGLLIAVAGNVSATSTAQELWTNPDARAAIADAATKISDEQQNAETDTAVSSDALEAFEDAVDRLDELGFPVGWDDQARQVWKDAVDPEGDETRNVSGALAMVAGWFITAALVMLGAPFWFDLLTRLVALRGSGMKPPPAAEDKASATGLLEAASKTDSPAPQDDNSEFAANVGITALLPAASTAAGTSAATSATAGVAPASGKLAGDQHSGESRWQRVIALLRDAFRIAWTGS